MKKKIQSFENEKKKDGKIQELIKIARKKS